MNRPSPASSVLRAVLRAIGRAYLRLFRWQLVGEPPESSRLVMIAAPHTSNWDLVIMLACAWSYAISIRWIGKKEIFRMPILGPFLRWTGGIPIDRANARDTVAQVVKLFEGAPQMRLCIAPEGTRHRRDTWRSGFYHIACGARVPIVFGFIDYGTRRAGCGPTLDPTGDVARDMDRVRAFYEPIRGLRPDRQGPVRLAEEDAPQARAATG